MMATTTLMTPVKEYIRRHQIRVVELAQRLGISRQFLSEIVNGWVSEETMRRWAPLIAEALGASQYGIFPSLKETPTHEYSIMGDAMRRDGAPVPKQAHRDHLRFGPT